MGCQSLSDITHLSKYKFTAIVLYRQLAPDQKSQLGEIEAEKDRGGKLADCFHHNIIMMCNCFCSLGINEHQIGYLQIGNG